MSGHFSHTVASALKETIVKVFWRKEDTRTLFNIAGVDQKLINAQDWGLYKFHIVSPIVDALNVSDEGIGPLRRILQETLAYQNCNHLLRFNNGKRLKREAEESLSNLRSLVQDHDAAKQTEKEEREARQKRLEEAQKGRAFQEQLGGQRDRYLQLLSKTNETERGYDLEKLLNQIFELFEMSPHAPFKRVGEQIDGAFLLYRDHFLLEAKWQQSQTNLEHLRDLDGAVGSSLDNTLGLFLSISGFSPQAISGYSSGNRPRIICMDGGDLMLVLDGRIDLPELLSRKKDIAVQRKLIYVPANKIIVGKY